MSNSQEKKPKKPKKAGSMQVIRNKKGQFIKGVSGNPVGKIPGTVSITTEIKRKLKEVPKGQKMSYLDGLIKRIMSKAVAEGDERMIRLIWNYVDGMPKQQTEISGKEGEPLVVKIVKFEEKKDGNNPTS